MTVVFSHRRVAGFLVRHCRGTEAFTADEKSLGTFRTVLDAAAAVEAAASAREGEAHIFKGGCL
jgi:hypothetical protein